jgi:hypothetical protein
MIAALYVETAGAYFGLEGVDPWDESRDARRYAGPDPVVAHPPCSRWCQLASVNEARWGAKIGDDGGTFAAALHAVRTFGGVLEHPAYSIAWSRFGLPRPSRGCWSKALDDDGWVTEVSQVAYGHAARKRTWLYAVGTDLPDLDWSEPAADAVIGNGINSGECIDRPKLLETLYTPPTFRQVLVDMARSVRR